MFYYEINCIVNDDELRWFEVRARNEDDAVEMIYENVWKVTEILEVTKLEDDQL